MAQVHEQLSGIYQVFVYFIEIPQQHITPEIEFIKWFCRRTLFEDNIFIDAIETIVQFKLVWNIKVGKPVKKSSMVISRGANTGLSRNVLRCFLK